jgi:CRISPR-associated protein Cmr5
MRQTLDLKRASDTWGKVHRIMVEQKDEDWKDKYASYVENLPATVLTCGLGQAAAILLSAAAKTSDALNDPHMVLYVDLESWLCRPESEAPYAGQHNLMQAIVNGNRQTYMNAQAEALAWLTWLKKLAVAYLKKEKGDQ